MSDTGLQELVPQLRIAVNSRCQKACFYCRPSGEGSVQIPAREISTDEIVLAVRALSKHGISDLKLTGGDPALKPDIVELVHQLKTIPGIRSIHLVTRHPRAGVLAKQLAEAGLDCLNFSIDTLDPETFKKITGVNGLGALLQAVKTSVPVSRSVKINTVVMRGVNDHELADLIQFCEDAGVATLKLLDLIMDMSPEGDSFAYRLAAVAPGRTFLDLYYPLDGFADYLSTISASQETSYQPGGLGHPMLTYRMRSGLRIELKDARRGAWYGNICRGCSLYPCHDALMALRLTTEGKLQRCLARADNLLEFVSRLRAPDHHDAETAIEEALQTYRTAEFNPHPEMLAQRNYPLAKETA